MNLLVGVLCEEGVVVGSADSAAATSGGSGLLEERTSGTLVVEKDLILAGSGRVGLAQRFAALVTAIRSDSRFPNWTGLTIARAISTEVVNDFTSTRYEKGQFGAMVAFHCIDGFQLCELAASDLQPEMKTPQRWFASMGAGRSLAEAFLGFLRRTVFSGSPPGLEEAAFAAAWALDYAAGPSAGVAPGPWQIAVLTREAFDMPCAARLLSAEELADQIARVRAAEKHLGAYRRDLSCAGE